MQLGLPIRYGHVDRQTGKTGARGYGFKGCPTQVSKLARGFILPRDSWAGLSIPAIIRKITGHIAELKIKAKWQGHTGLTGRIWNTFLSHVGTLHELAAVPGVQPPEPQANAPRDSSCARLRRPSGAPCRFKIRSQDMRAGLITH